MAQQIFGDLHVKRTGIFDRRVNQGLSKETLTAERLVSANDYFWLQLINATAQDVVLPDATTISEGWQIIIKVDSTSAAGVNVKTYDETTPVLVKNINVDKAFTFTLTDGTAAAGVWHMEQMEEADTLPADRYVDNFNATTDWTGPAAGYYTRVITGATHGRGVNPNMQIRLGGSAPYSEIQIDSVSIASNGNVTLSVPSDPDLRFAGNVLFV